MKAYALARVENGQIFLDLPFEEMPAFNSLLAHELPGIIVYEQDPDTGEDIPGTGTVTRTGWAVFVVAATPETIDDLDKNDNFVLITTLTEDRPEWKGPIDKDVLKQLNDIYALHGKEALKDKKKNPYYTGDPDSTEPEEIDKTLGELVMELFLDVLEYPPLVSAPILHAAFTVDVKTGPPPLTVTFTDQSTAAVSWVWDFDDGSFVTDQNPIHTFTEEGKFKVKLDVEDANGKKDGCAEIINVFVPEGP